MPATDHDLPEPFASALARGRVGDVVDQEANTPAAHLARARARISAGRFDEAREDLDAAEAEMGDAALIERAWLDLRQRGALREALRIARDITQRAGDDTRLRARALHVLGHAQARLRRSQKGITTLLEARAAYAEAGDERAVSHVNDSIGQVYASRGDLEQALFHYSLSLVDKATLGDRLGMAVTTGNIGRLHLRAGRYEDAIACFERDLEISVEVGDLRGQARMLEDLGRAYAGLEDDARAEEAFLACLDLAASHGFTEILFYAHLDLAALRLRQGRVDDAAKEIDAACATGLDRETPFFALILEAARGELLLAQDKPEAFDVLQRSLRRLAHADLPDDEIPVRLRLARAFMDRGFKALAERTLLGGVRRARRSGTPRYLPALNEAMTELRLVEGVLDETGRGRRKSGGAEGEPADGAYVLLEKLGEGTYGEVYRAYDPRRAREVALKVVHLERVYEKRKRRRLIDSVRVELEAASRVRHPGVARVLAIGREEDGGLYVVEEYVPGESLRTLMQASEDPPVLEVAGLGRRLAHALGALHDAEVVHRDLKPENVRVRADGTPVLVDFGIAHVGLAAAGEPGAGTLEYMAPEQARGDAVDGRTDLYALGVILFEWLVGFRPLQLKDHDRETWQRILEEEIPPRVREFRPDVPPEMDELVASLLAKRRTDRPPDAAAVAEALVRCQAPCEE